VTIRWTPEAVQDLARLYDFLASYDARAALRVVSVLRDAVHRLLAHPRLGAPLPGFDEREVRRLLIGDYEMRYELSQEAIHILRFFNTCGDR
jgi:plasmid stabilization system protein ParE